MEGKRKGKRVGRGKKMRGRKGGKSGGGGGAGERREVMGKRKMKRRTGSFSIVLSFS